MAAACAPAPAVVLATITDVEPAVVEPGDVIAITGTGFVEGGARVAFHGAFDPVGLAPPREREVILEGTAVSGTRIEVPVTSVLMARLAAEPVDFRGTVRVSFPTALPLGAVRISAQSAPLGIGLRPAGEGVPSTARRSREAQGFLHRLGIRMASKERSDELLVEQVAPGSPADRAGVEAGDRLLALDGVALAARTDLAGIGNRPAYELEVVSPQGTLRDLRLQPNPDDRLDLDEFAAVLLASIALGLFLAFVAPSRQRGDRSGDRGADLIPRVLGTALVSIPMLLAPALVTFGTADLAATLALLALGVAGCAGVALYGGGRALARLLGFAAHLLPLPVTLLLAGALGNTIGIIEVISGQELTPWGWYVWANPFTLVTLVAAVSLLWCAPRDGASPVARVAAWLSAAGGAMLLTACGLGGWLVPGVPFHRLAEEPVLLLAGTLLFVAKTWLVLLAARWFAGVAVHDRRDGRRRGRPQLALRALVLLAAAGAALAWEWSTLPDDLIAAGQLLASGAFVALAVAFIVRSVHALLPRRSLTL